VELRYHADSPEEVEVFFDGRSFGNAILLDRGVNFKIGRNQKLTSSKEEENIKPGELF